MLLLKMVQCSLHSFKFCTACLEDDFSSCRVCLKCVKFIGVVFQQNISDCVYIKLGGVGNLVFFCPDHMFPE